MCRGTPDNYEHCIMELCVMMLCGCVEQEIGTVVYVSVWRSWLLAIDCGEVVEV